jgi:ABC-type multidrug transport system permease subunit
MGGTSAAGVLPITGGPDSFWFWIVVFVLISAGFAVLRLFPRKTKDDS